MAVADNAKLNAASPPSGASSHAAMNTPFKNAGGMSPNFALLREVVRACLCEVGAPADAKIPGIVVDLGPLGDWPIRFFAPPALDDLERVIVDAIAQSAKPLQQKEIAKAAHISIRLVQRTTPRLQERGILLRHPSMGFYLPGMQVEEVEGEE